MNPTTDIEVPTMGLRYAISSGKTCSPLRAAWILGLLALLLGVWGCRESPEGWTPVLDETSTGFLETEVERLDEHVRNALGHLDTDPARAKDELGEARMRIEHLRNYYLPLLEARQRAYNAYRSHHLGDEDRVARELNRIEEILASMAEQAEGSRLREIEALAEVLADARMASAAGPGEGRKELETLARWLNEAALEGDLILKR